MSFFSSFKNIFSSSDSKSDSRRSSTSESSSVSSSSTVSPVSSAEGVPNVPGGPSTDSESQSTSTEPKGLNGGELDLVFLVDATGSMSSYIQTAQKSIADIVEKITAAEKADVQFALVAYRDWSDAWQTQISPFTSSISKMKQNISSLTASGGGDAPEAITAGLHEVLNLPYRKNSTKIVVLIGDAPDHGLGESGDSYPNGDPKGRDPLIIARQMSDKGIMLYAVGCEPSLSNSTYGRDFFILLAKITQGQYLPLASSHLLPKVIISGAKEELSLERLTDQMEKEMKQVKSDAKEKGETISEDQVVKRVFAQMKSKGVTSAHTNVTPLWSASSYNHSNVDAMSSATSLASARKLMKANLNDHVKVDESAAKLQSVSECVDSISEEQVTRAYFRNMKTKWSS